MVRERNEKPVVVDYKPKQLKMEPVSEPVNMDLIIHRELKHQLAIASMAMHLFKVRPRIFKTICIAVDVDHMDIYEWAREVLRYT